MSIWDAIKPGRLQRRLSDMQAFNSQRRHVMREELVAAHNELRETINKLVEQNKVLEERLQVMEASPFVKNRDDHQRHRFELANSNPGMTLYDD